MNFKKPWLNLPAGVAHSLSTPILKLYGATHAPRSYPWGSFSWKGLHFSNPLGTSGGVDKNAELMDAWWALGAGFVEVGTITPQPQGPNPGEILLRDNARQALWNKMGFPNDGVKVVRSRLSQLKRPHFTPVFVNVGKNRQTLNEQAAQDYLQVIQELRDFADAFVVNISSPNTADLRELLKPENLKKFLAQLLSKSEDRPLLLKLSPDMTVEDFISALQVSSELGISGWIITNTTLERTSGLSFPKDGGVSGQPLAERAEYLLKIARKTLGDQKGDRLLVSAGGVLSSDDVFRRLELGADLVQVYSALIFQGPSFFSQVAKAALNAKPSSHFFDGASPCP